MTPSSDETDVAIVGSGPYALSLAAQLRGRSVEHRIMGPPMKFWRDMPPGLNLKSLAFATNIYVPEPGHTFPEWCRLQRIEDHEPCTMESFATYGLEMQSRFVPHLEILEVTHVGLAWGSSRRFEVTRADGSRIVSRRVVFATGLTHFARWPQALEGLPAELASHTSEHREYRHFRGKRVAVIGAGASAIEAGVLVHEAGGEAQVLVREERAIFHDKTPRQRPLRERIRNPDSSLGASRTTWLMDQLPLAVHFLPEKRRVRFVRGLLGPSSPWWIRHRCEGNVPIHVRTTLVAAERAGDGLLLRLRGPDGERTLRVDHVIAGTGFDANVDRILYIEPGLRSRIRRVAGAPDLSLRFESSVRGAYFLGPIAAMSFGPVSRFVAGARYAAPALARHLASRWRW